MKKKLLVGALLLGSLIGTTGCNQMVTRNFGGEMTIDLPKDTKLEMITWKDDDSLWYLTRPMTETDIAESYKFQQQSEFGLFEGTVYIQEYKSPTSLDVD